MKFIPYIYPVLFLTIKIKYVGTDSPEKKSADPDQTAIERTGWSGATLFAFPSATLRRIAALRTETVLF